jgi:ribosomal protein S12
LWKWLNLKRINYVTHTPPLSIEKYRRTRKVRRNKVAPFLGAPQRKGVVYKIATMSPRKPNSARRTFAKVRILITIKKYLLKYQV